MLSKRCVVVEANGVKRELPLPFAICVTRQEAYAIKDAMNQFLGEENCTYGWVTVHSDTAEQRANTKAIPWEASAEQR